MRMPTYPATRDEKVPKAGVKSGWMERIRQAIGKLVVLDKDAIFKDPDWPHLWEHKR